MIYMATHTWRGEPTIDTETLTKYIDKGLTYEQMAEEWFKTHGTRRQPVSFAAAAARRGLKGPRARPRYENEIPWRLRAAHGTAFEARMLRLLGRRNAGVEMSGEDNKRLDSFLRKLDNMSAVVHYDPETDRGFFFVAREPQDGDGYVRRPPSED